MAISVTYPSSAAVPSTPKISGNGLVVNNNGHLVGRSLLAGGAARIINPEGIEGRPVVEVPSQRVLFKAKGLDCSVAGEFKIGLAVPGVRYFRLTEVLVTNATAAPVELRAGLTTRQDGGVAIVPGSTDYAELADDLYLTKEITLAGNLREKRADPYLFWRVITPNTNPLKVDVYVLGDILDMEL